MAGSLRFGIIDAARREAAELRHETTRELRREPIGSLDVIEAFPAFQFSNPLFLVSPPDGRNRVFVLEQDGRVLWFENSSSVTDFNVALDITARVRRVNGEEGLLGLAFHPRYSSNRQVFLYYSASDPVRNRVVRYTMDQNLERIDPNSEVAILEIEKPFGNHNGGMMAFGPDGYLYIGIGDGGSGGDPFNNAQNKNVLLGKILRIEIDRADGGLAYAIPSDNPFSGQAGARGEVWALGLRNPWRFSFDRQTGTLWAGDVGQSTREEIDVIKRGANYGWNFFEGTFQFRSDPSSESFEAPIVEHGRDEARSITGGYVYRGSRIPRLAGSYVYGDFVTGNIWALRYENGVVTEHVLAAMNSFISSFGEDANGEMYFMSFDGKIYTFR